MIKNLLFIAIICFSLNSNAQIYFRNNTNEPVYIAFAFKYTGRSFDGWETKGWYECAPNEKIAISEIVGSHDYVYYYARSKSGKSYNGDSKFLVDPRKSFTIRNADMEYVKKEQKTLQWFPFRSYRLNGLKKIRCTIELNY